MELIHDYPVVELQAPPNHCAEVIVSYAMAKSAEDLIQRVVRPEGLPPSAEFLAGTKFVVKCGMEECEGRIVLSKVGTEDKMFHSPHSKEFKSGNCPKLLPRSIVPLGLHTSNK